jgi:hypothetical protein
LFLKPIEHNDPTASPNFEFPVFEAEEDDVEGIPDEISRFLEQEKKITPRHPENQQNSQPGHQKKSIKKKKTRKERVQNQKKSKERKRKKKKTKEK